MMKSRMMSKGILFLLMAMFVLGGCTVDQEKDEQENSSADEFTEMQNENLQKLCKVWGYVKYRHPVFISGSKDWDEELFQLIEETMNLEDEQEMNELLNDWLKSLGETESYKQRDDSVLADTSESKTIVLADLKWVHDEEYLGKELSESLTALENGFEISYREGPAFFNGSVIDFSNEKQYESVDFSDIRYRLLGVFRIWNAIEYYYPYLDLLETDWEIVLENSIDQMREGQDEHSYQLVLAKMAAELHDAHAAFQDNAFLFDEFGWYFIPVNFVLVDHQIVISRVYDEVQLFSGETVKDLSYGLQPGDIVLKLNDVEIEKVIEQRLEYLSVPTDEKIVNTMTPFLLRAKEPEIRLTVLRQGEEITFTEQGVKSAVSSIVLPEESHQLLEGNIGLINPGKLVSGELPGIMDEFKNTEGLIVDLRQYPYEEIAYQLAEYIVDGQRPFCSFYYPTESVPGSFYKGRNMYSGSSEGASYQKPVVLLMDETSQSSSEFTIMSLRNGDNVTVIGKNSCGTDGNYISLPLPCGNTFTFTGLGVMKVDDQQTQRIGLTPDIIAEPTVEGIRQGRDEMMETAVRYLLEEKE